LFGNYSGSVAGIDIAQQLKPPGGTFASKHARRLDKFTNSFVTEQPADEQERHLIMVSGHGRRREAVKVDTRPRQEARLAGLDNIPRHEQVAIVGVLEEDDRASAESEAIKQADETGQRTAAHKCGAEPTDIGQACHPRNLGGQRSIDIRLGREPEVELGPGPSKQPNIVQPQDSVPDRIQARPVDENIKRFHPTCLGPHRIDIGGGNPDRISRVHQGLDKLTAKIDNVPEAIG